MADPDRTVSPLQHYTLLLVMIGVCLGTLASAFSGHERVFMGDFSIRESRLRYDCERHGWRLMESRRSEEEASSSGGFMIVESLTGAVLAGGSPRAFSMTLEEVKDYLAARPKRTRR
jgi:hypothetical protein